MFFAAPARGDTEAVGPLAPQDTVEISVSRWSALRGGAPEALTLIGVYTIDEAGRLDLPIIGHLRAAGLRVKELAKLITDRLQARSGLPERPLTTVERKPSAEAQERPGIERRLSLAQSKAGEPRVQVSTVQRRALKKVRSGADAFLGDLSAARRELEAARAEALAVRRAAREEAAQSNQRLAAERKRTAGLLQELSAARSNLEAVKAHAAQEAAAASQARQGAEALANMQREMAARERAKRAAAEKDLLLARKEIDALKKSTQTADGAREKALRRELVAARAELDATRRAAENADAQAQAAADRMAAQERVLEEQRQKAEGLARGLALAQQEVERLKAGAVRARKAAEVSLSEARRALDVERQKTERLEHDLAAARQSIDALEASAKLAAAAQATATQNRQTAEAAAKRAGEALVEERERAGSLARDLEAARQERDAVREELARVSAALREAQRERDKAIGVARDLTAARRENDMLKALGELPPIPVERPPETRAAARPSARADAPARTQVRSTRQSGVRQVRRGETRKPPRPAQLTSIVLPESLLPTRPPSHSLR